MNNTNIVKQLLQTYYNSFINKTYIEENNDTDILMEIFGITPEQKRENRQYWGRELGMLWQRIITNLSEMNCKNYEPALRINCDEPCDLLIDKDAIDTKYRIGSGDSGTLKKFKNYAKLLSEQGYNPILLILRNDNLLSAIQACRNSGWQIYTGQESFNYLQKKLNIDVEQLLKNEKNNFLLSNNTLQKNT